MTRRVFAIALLLAAVAAARADDAPPGQPRVGELNSFVLQVIGTIPADGTHRYWWPKGTSFGGTTRDLVYDGATICESEPEGRTYCCGLTFEALFRAWEQFAAKKKAPFKIGALDGPGLRKLKGDWFCSGDVREGPVAALVPRRLGARVESLEDARAGDFVQLWRKKGSGHSVVFLDWERRGGAIVGLKYWSTQTATNGVGTRVESFDGDNGIVREKLYIARAGVP